MSTAVEVRPALVSLSFRSRPRPVVSTAAIVLCDALAQVISIAPILLLCKLFHAYCELGYRWHLWPILGLFALVYSALGLYPGVAIGPVTEIRRLTVANTLTFVILIASNLVLRDWFWPPSFVVVVPWITACILVPFGRSSLRQCLSTHSWWGYPVVVFGTGEVARTVVSQLQSQPESGFKPVAILGNDASGGDVSGVPVIGGLDTAMYFAGAGVRHAMVAMPELPHDELLELMESHVNVFPHVLVVPKLHGLSSLGAETRDCCSMRMLQLRNCLLLRGPRIAKRAMDLCLSLIVGVFAAPLIAVIALLIKVESRGPVFYSHIRIGRDGIRFRAWKFRSMIVDNGNYILRKYFEVHPEESHEWECNYKLKNDPRITLVGRFLRKTSLDELPQFWNILRGEMSLVGPRPIVDEEILKYGQQFALYKQVIPGLTGLWQVCGRSDTTYPERVELDAYYIRNWSPWLDIYLLARTVAVVLKGQGAY